MLVYACECGQCKAIGSKAPSKCTGCPDCGTRITSYPDPGSPEPHGWSVREVETDSGPAELTYCAICGKSRNYLEAEGQVEIVVEDEDEDEEA